MKVYALMCSPAGLNAFMEDLRSAKPDRIVIAACSPLNRENQFQQALEELNINPYLMQMVSVCRVYAAGACRTPMDIRSSVNEGQAASGRILVELKTRCL